MAPNNCFRLILLLCCLLHTFVMIESNRCQLARIKKRSSDDEAITWVVNGDKCVHMYSFPSLPVLPVFRSWVVNELEVFQEENKKVKKFLHPNNKATLHAKSKESKGKAITIEELTTFIQSWSATEIYEYCTRLHHLQFGWGPDEPTWHGLLHGTPIVGESIIPIKSN
jgi:hypothetical protein